MFVVVVVVVAGSAVCKELVFVVGDVVVDDGFGHWCFYYCHVVGQTEI